MKNLTFICAISFAMLLTGTSCSTTKKTVEKPPQNNYTTSKPTQEMKTLPDSLLNGEWLFKTACGQPVVGDNTVHITLDMATKRVYGHNGCNIFNGAIETGKNTTLLFPNTITTLMACRPDVTDGNVMQAVNATTHYAVVKHTNDEITINLLDKEGTVVATISRQLRELLNGYWNIIEVDGSRIKLDESPTAVLDITARKLTGNAGCNLMNGAIEYDATTVNNGLRFSGVATTRRMCDPATMQVERNILQALEKVDAFRIIDSNRIGLYQIPSDQNLLVLERKQ